MSTALVNLLIGKSQCSVIFSQLIKYLGEVILWYWKQFVHSGDKTWPFVPCECTYVCTYIRTYVYTYMCTCVLTCVRM